MRLIFLAPCRNLHKDGAFDGKQRIPIFSSDVVVMLVSLCPECGAILSPLTHGKGLLCDESRVLEYFQQHSGIAGCRVLLCCLLT